MRPELYQTAIKNIEARMRDLSLSQTQLAARAKLPHQSIYKLLRGLRSPTLISLEKIAKALRCEPYELLATAPAGTFQISKDALHDVFCVALEKLKKRDSFAGLTEASPEQMNELVLKFGGWNFLYAYLCEELEVRAMAEKDYQALRDSLNETMTEAQLSNAKRKMIISKMIAKQKGIR